MLNGFCFHSKGQCQRMFASIKFNQTTVRVRCGKRWNGGWVDESWILERDSRVWATCLLGIIDEVVVEWRLVDGESVAVWWCPHEESLLRTDKVDEYATRWRETISNAIEWNTFVSLNTSARSNNDITIWRMSDRSLQHCHSNIPFGFN